MREHPHGIVTIFVIFIIIINAILIIIWVGLSHGPTNKSWLFALCRGVRIVPERYSRWCFMAAFKSFHQKDASRGITPAQCWTYFTPRRYSYNTSTSTSPSTQYTSFQVITPERGQRPEVLHQMFSGIPPERCQ